MPGGRGSPGLVWRANFKIPIAPFEPELSWSSCSSRTSMPGLGEKRRESIGPDSTLSTRLSMSFPGGSSSTLSHTKTVFVSPSKRPSSGRG